MYDFWYNYIKRRYGSSAQLQMTDTDSLLFYCETRDIYEDMSMSMEEFDTSEYLKNHPLQSDNNKKALGKMKDETKGFPISEFVGLRSKMYSFLSNQKEEKRANGVAQVTVKKDISHEQYKECLFGEKKLISSMSSLRSHKHELYCDTLQTTGLSAFDDKRYLINNIESTHMVTLRSLKNVLVVTLIRSFRWWRMTFTCLWKRECLKPWMSKV